MKATPLKSIEETQHLKIIKNKKRVQKKSVPVKLKINTLNPKFNYFNSNGEQTSPSKFILL